MQLIPCRQLAWDNNSIVMPVKAKGIIIIIMECALLNKLVDCYKHDVGHFVAIGIKLGNDLRK